MDKKREIELKPCPYCGGTDLGIGFNAVGERHYVVCSHCLMRGPEKLGDGDRAAKYWNALSSAPIGKPALACFDDYLDKVLRRQAVVNAGVTFRLRCEVAPGKFETEDFLYEHGIRDYLAELAGEDPLTEPVCWETERRGRDRADKPEYKCKINVALTFSNKISVAEYYHNSSWLEHGGAPEKAVRNAFVYQIDSYLKQTGKYNKNESKITFADVEDCLVIVISSFSSVTSYENQTKKAITNKGIQEAMVEMLRHQLEIYFIENPLDADKIAGQVLINKRSREDAEKTRLNLKKKLTSNMDITSRVAKFVDCRSKDVNLRELFIVEGDSALGACKQARDPDFQAIIPIRGKILNCLKADYDKIFKNDIITDLIKVLGCGVQVKSKANKELASFDLNQLRWSKVILCTDADVDGAHIRTLLLTFFFRQYQEMVERGFVYIAQPPLYRAHNARFEKFIKDDAELNDFLLRRISEDVTVEAPNGRTYTGEELLRLMALVEKLDIRVRDAESTGMPRALFLALTTYAQAVTGDMFAQEDSALTEWIAGHGYSMRLDREEGEDGDARLFVTFENEGSHHTRRGMEFFASKLYRQTWQLFEELRTAAFLQKSATGDPVALPAYETLKLATVNGARAMGYAEGELGVIRPGALADLIGLLIYRRYKKPTVSLPDG